MPKIASSVATQELRRQLASPHEEVRLAALIGRKFSRPEEVAIVSSAFQNKRQPESIRIQAAKALRRTTRAEAIQSLVQVMLDPGDRANVRWIAADILSAVGRTLKTPTFTRVKRKPTPEELLAEEQPATELHDMAREAINNVMHQSSKRASFRKQPFYRNLSKVQVHFVPGEHAKVVLKAAVEAMKPQALKQKAQAALFVKQLRAMHSRLK